MDLGEHLAAREQSAPNDTIRQKSLAALTLVKDVGVEIDHLLTDLEQVVAAASPRDQGIAEAVVQKLGGMSREAWKAHAALILIIREAVQLHEAEAKLRRDLAAQAPEPVR